jgi:cysteinyl-tRNA synthetase
MSKSLGNFFTVRDLLDQGIPGEVIRFVMLSTHYRKPMDWTEKKREEAGKNLSELAKALESAIAHDAKPTGNIGDVVGQVASALSDDLNTSGALTALILQAKALTRMSDDNYEPLDFSEMAVSFVTGLELLGLYELLQERINSTSENKFDLSALETRLAEVRASAMETKDFSEVDRLKTALIEAGVEVRMSKAGVEMVPGAAFDEAKLEGL